MKTIKGTIANKGLVLGKIKVFSDEKINISKDKITDTASEIAKLDAAVKKSIDELDKLFEKAKMDAGEEEAQIFEVHKMMLDDIEYQDEIRKSINEEKDNAAYAVSLAEEKFYMIFNSMDDEYFSQRAKDIKDISQRLIKNILGIKNVFDDDFDEKVILYAEDLLPSQTLNIDKEKLLAIVTVKGSTQSHTAILAKSMNIASLVNLDSAFDKDIDGKTAILDAYEGELIIDPDEKLLKDVKERIEKEEKRKLELEKLKTAKAISKDGTHISVYANIGNSKDLPLALKNGAEGIGLFRTEFLYLGRDSLPTEEEQFKEYKYVAETMEGKEVIVRTFDIGADKKVDYLNLPEEENPALGYRAIRICLDDEELFKAQLRAIIRASHYGNIKIMLPMINDLWEVKKAKELIKEIFNELREKDIPFNEEIEIGIMIETPAAAIISDDLAKEVSFFSIGTNDLTQYTLAVDRQNEKIARHRDIHHKAILRLMELTCENAKKNGVKISVCGELGSDPDLTEFYIKNKFDKLSVNPGQILELKDRIINS